MIHLNILVLSLVVYIIRVKLGADENGELLFRVDAGERAVDLKHYASPREYN